MKPQIDDYNTENENDLAARLVALQLLEQVLDRKTTLDIALDSNAGFANLSVRDRAFARMLLTTALRRLGQIDDLITFAQDRPDSLKNMKIRHILRLGVTQIFFMGVADHASVDTSVRLAEHIGADQQKGFVNAVLRKLLREGEKRLQNQDAPRINTPEWLLKSWIADYGLGTAAVIAQANLNEAPLDITVKDKSERAYWANVLKATELPTGTLRRMGGGNIRELDGFDEGKWWIQDASAAIPASLLGDIKGVHVIDMCAAPGGKTLQMASMSAYITAIDRSAQRLKRLEENLVRMDLKEKVQIAVADSAIWTPADAVPYILLDAPCSATGTVRRHPDTLYLKTPEDISRLTIIQEKLLMHAADILEIGGIIVYCTCSLQKDEGERQIEKFLRKRPKMKRIPIKAEEIGGHGELIDENGDLRILPSHLPAHGGMDGFFASRLTKIK